MEDFYYNEGSLPAWRQYKENIRTVIISEGVTSIGNYAFSGCANLSGITIPSGVTSIGNHAFMGCADLSSITIPSGVTSIGNRAFSDCTGLSSVTIPTSVTSIGNDAFYGCSSLGGITIPSGVTSIGNWAFSYCSSLSSITIPSGVTSIGNYAFMGCTDLSSITIPSSVTSIGNYAFYICSSLSGITIPSGVTSIGDYTFSSCTDLSSITIPSSVTSIGYHAFYGCSSLRGITIPSGVTSIGDGAFSNCSSLHSITIPSGVTSIGYGAFNGCTNLSSVTIPWGVTSIGNYAFWDCSNLSSITIPTSVTSIGNSAFSFCSSLRSITIPSGVTSIGENTFIHCSDLNSITIPSSVTSIGASAFAWCDSLSSITIPSSVTSIDAGAFNGCTALSDVYYSGSEAQWQAIEIGADNYALRKAIIHYNNTQVPIPVVTSTVCDPKDGIVTGRFGTTPGTKKDIPNEFTITVTAQGDGLSYSWLWREEGETQSQWKDVSNISLMMVIGSQTSNALTIRSEDMNLNGHNYEFMCMVYNGYAHAVSSIVTIHFVDPDNLHPVIKPTISAHPKSVTTSGSRAAFSVTAEGSDLRYQWQVRKSPDSSWENATDTGNRTAALTVAVTTQKNGYQYRCAVSNRADTVYSNAATLKLKGPGPEITSITCEHSTITGSTHYHRDIPNKCDITVTASGDNLSYSWKWRKKGTGAWQDMNTLKVPLFVGNGTTSNTLELHCSDSTVNGNSYDFKCTVSNQYGSASETITIHVISID